MNGMTTLRYRVDTQLARLLAEGYRSSDASFAGVGSQAGRGVAQAHQALNAMRIAPNPRPGLHSLPDFVIWSLLDQDDEPASGGTR
jgi:hypothetical protein